MTDIIDYAAPMMRIEKLLRDMHNDLLNRDMGQAFEKASVLIVESRLLANTLVLMKEQQDALRKQTPSVQERIRTVPRY